jgi:hypothetical protein
VGEVADLVEHGPARRGCGRIPGVGIEGLEDRAQRELLVAQVVDQGGQVGRHGLSMPVDAQIHHR